MGSKKRNSESPDQRLTDDTGRSGCAFSDSLHIFIAIWMMHSGQGVITEDDIPVTLRMLLGYTTRERLNTFVHDIIENSLEKDHIEMSPEIYEALMDLRGIMFQNVYTHPGAKEEELKAIKMLKKLYVYYTENPEEMSEEYRLLMKRGESKAQVVCDYLSGMTDQYSMAKFRKIFIPKSWEVY